MTTIHDVELTEPTAPIPTTPDADRCLLILRWHGRIVGRVVTPVAGGELRAEDVAALLKRADLSAGVHAWIDELTGHDDRAARNFSPPPATVAICTRERPDDLRRVLSALPLQRHPPVEVLVVDNAPVTEATREIVHGSGSARYVREDRRGLDAARNRALREARGGVVAFTDDDAVPDPDWLGVLVSNFSDPSVAVVTGLTLPLELETEAQEYFEEHGSFIKGFRRRVFDGHRDNPLSVGLVGAGANMAVRADSLRALGGFDERLDGGMPTRSGGDHDLFARVLMAGHRIVYDPAAVSRHRHRRTHEELAETVYGYGVGVYAMWTGFVLERREIGVARLAWQWFVHSQLKRLLRPTTAVGRRLAWQELRGCLDGPRSWLAARRIREQET